jgi:hypothetical protein
MRGSSSKTYEFPRNHELAMLVKYLDGLCELEHLACGDIYIKFMWQFVLQSSKKEMWQFGVVGCGPAVPKSTCKLFFG